MALLINFNTVYIIHRYYNTEYLQNIFPLHIARHTGSKYSSICHLFIIYNLL
jgi:hypothetical protein